MRAANAYNNIGKAIDETKDAVNVTKNAAEQAYSSSTFTHEMHHTNHSLQLPLRRAVSRCCNRRRNRRISPLPCYNRLLTFSAPVCALTTTERI